jgi:hypothetical protein
MSVKNTKLVLNETTTDYCPLSVRTVSGVSQLTTGMSLLILLTNP